MEDTKPTVFISYSHKDEHWKDRLVPQLGVLQEQALLEVWQDRQIAGGDDWYHRIMEAIESASVAVLLVSANALSSDFIMNKEMPRLRERREKDGVRIIPVIVEPCDWESVDWLRRLQIRPKDAKPLSGFTRPKAEEILAAVVTEIRVLLSRVVQRAEPKEWVPVPPDDISTARLPISGKFLFGREYELELLDGAWADADTNVLSMVAWGGVGKSELVNHWLAAMAKEHYRGARRVYGWSFHDQGARETATSADPFIDHALRWFDDDDPMVGSPRDKGERLARLVRRERALLILDGLEPLQYPPGPDGGRLREGALSALVRELAAANPGLCILTTRLPITDLQSWSRTTAPVIKLEHLSDTAGAALLHALGVQGVQKELEKASREFRGHGLALNLLGTYLRDVCAGDVRRREEIPLRDEDEEHGGYAWRVLASYEKWLGEGPELAVLRLLSLFDRPAEGELLDVLRKPPAIADLTDTLVGLGGRWGRVLARLRQARLLAEAEADAHGPDTLDTHPLVREYFSEQVQEQFPEAWREGHKRLYEYMKEKTTYRPDNVEGMTALSQAVAHGCQAGRHQEVLDEVYRERMHRGPEAYNQFILGAISDDLAAVSCFFDRKISDRPWQEPAAELSAKSKGYVLNEAGWDLRALGRLEEARQPMIKAFEVRCDAEDWIAAANSAANCSTILLQIGELDEAFSYAKKGVKVAERSNDRPGPWGPQHSYNRAFLGEALHKAGKSEEARKAFDEAEQIQAKSDSDHPLLHAVMAGFLYCDFLLDQGEYKNVKKRVIETLEWNKKKKRLRDIAFDHLSLGRANLIEALQKEPTGDLSEATMQIDKAVKGLREARQEDHLLHGLLARAALRREQRRLDEAWADVKEVLEIAESGPMKLHEADAYLESARLCVKEDDRDKARDYLDRAKVMIERMGYHRRDQEVTMLEKVLVKGKE